MEQTVNEFIEVMEKAFKLSKKIADENVNIDRMDWNIRIAGRNGVNADISERLTEAMKRAGLKV